MASDVVAMELGTGASNFVLPPSIAKKLREFADKVYFASPSERLDALTTCARYVAGIVSERFPKQEAVDRLWATAEAAGIVREYGETLVQFDWLRASGSR